MVILRNGHRCSIFLLAVALLLGAGRGASASTEQGAEYPDGHGDTVFLPLGDLSFADGVVKFESGSPAAAHEKDRQPQEAPGIPDYDEAGGDRSLTLGCGGTVILRFVDNVLTDVDGRDLYIFEIGPAVEPTGLAISTHGERWIDVGRVAGGKAAVDLAALAAPGEFYYYVRLQDDRSGCDGGWPGADIDAVAAIGSSVRFSLESSVLFDFDRWDFTAAAREELGRLATSFAAYPEARVLVAGHTDSVGTSAYKLELSRKRARSVLEFLAGRSELRTLSFEVRAFGETRPVGDNAAEEGRGANRRVEVIVFPASSG